MTKKKMILLSPLFVAAFVAFIALGGLLVMYLWNWLLPPLFGWPAIRFWQALALLLLCRILFGGWSGGGRSSRSNIRRRMAERWEHRWEQRWEQMTPEERERFRQRFQDRWGCAPRTDENPGA